MFLIFLSAAALTGCFKPSFHSTDDSSATFYMEEVKGASQVTNTSASWSLPTSRTYSFSVVARDAHSMDAIKNHNFVISDSKGNTIIPSVRTNSDGTLTWSEVVDYNYLSDAKYIPLTRIVTADGIHTGKRTLKIAVNPWFERHRRNPVKDVVDMTRVQLEADQVVSEEESALYLTGEKKANYQKRRLYIDGMIVQMTSTGPNAAQANLTVKLDMAPQILLHDTFNNLEGIPIQKAKFNIEVSLISKITEGPEDTRKDVAHRYLLGSTRSVDHKDSKDQPMLGDRVRFDLPLYQTYGSTIGQAELAIKLIPVEGPKDLEPFEGVFLVGNYNQNTGFSGNVPKLVTLRDDYKFHVSDFLTQNVVDLVSAKPTSLPSGIFAVEPFQFSFIQPIFSSVEIKNDRPYSRVSDITFQTTVTNPMDGHRYVPFIKFKIKGIDGEEKEGTTNQQGLLTWTDRLKFDTYKYRRYFAYDVTFTVPTTNWKKTFTIRVNPWAQFGYALGMDNRQISVKAQKYLLDEDSIIATQPYMGKLVLAFNENPIYSIKDDLRIEPYKSFILNLAPKVITPTDPLTGSDSVSSFRDGMYLLKLAVVSMIEGQRYITTYKKLVNVRDSQINEPVRLHMPDLRQMRIRNLLYVELHPVDYAKLNPFLVTTKGRAQFCPSGEKICNDNLDDLILPNSGLEDRTFVGMITPFSSKSEGPLRPTDDLDEFFDIDNQITSFLSGKGLHSLLSAPKTERGLTKQEMAFQNANETTAVDALSEDNMNSTFHGLPAFMKLLQDPRFKSDYQFPDPAAVLRFVTRGRNQNIKPVTVADLEKEEKLANQARETETQKEMSKDSFVSFANAEYIQESFLEDTFAKFPSIKSNNRLLQPSVAALIKDLNYDNNQMFGNRMVGVGNPIFPDYYNALNGRPYFEFNRGAVESLLPQLEPLNLDPKNPDEYVKKINRIVNSYKSVYQQQDIDIAFPFPKYKIKTGVMIDPMAATRLCLYWFKHMYAPLGYPDNIMPQTLACINKVKEGTPIENIFVLDQKIRVLERGRYVMDHGYFTRLNLGSAVRVNFGSSVAESTNYSFTPLKVLSFLPDFINSLFSWTAFQRAESHDRNESKSSDQSAGTTISSEEAKFYMVINAYERCSIIRMNPQYIMKQNLVEKYHVESDLNAQNWLRRGIMICTGQRETTPFLVPESYYYLTPDPFDGSELEISDPRGYVWVLHFRGPRDYTEFFNMLRKNGVKSYGIDGTKTYSKLAKLEDDPSDVAKLAEKPNDVDADKRPTAYIEMGIQDYKNSTGGVVVTYPGIYTVP